MESNLRKPGFRELSQFCLIQSSKNTLNNHFCLSGKETVPKIKIRIIIISKTLY